MPVQVFEAQVHPVPTIETKVKPDGLVSVTVDLTRGGPGTGRRVCHRDGVLGIRLPPVKLP